jgi:hypothetical protein
MVSLVRDIKFEVSEDGRSIRMTFVAQTGETMIAEMTAERFSEFMTDLFEVGVESQKRIGLPDDGRRAVRADPIPVSQMGIEPGRDPTQVILSARNGLLELLLAVDAGTLLATLRKLEAVSQPATRGNKTVDTTDLPPPANRRGPKPGSRGRKPGSKNKVRPTS